MDERRTIGLRTVAILIKVSLSYVIAWGSQKETEEIIQPPKATATSRVGQTLNMAHASSEDILKKPLYGLRCIALYGFKI